MKRNSRKNFVILFLRSKPFLPFLKNKKIVDKVLFWTLFLTIFLWCKRKVFANFKKIFIFKVPVIFLNWKFCRACAACARGKIRWFFWIKLIKYSHSIAMCPFSKIAKMKITPPYCTRFSWPTGKLNLLEDDCTRFSWPIGKLNLFEDGTNFSLSKGKLYLIDYDCTRCF